MCDDDKVICSPLYCPEPCLNVQVADDVKMKCDYVKSSNGIKLSETTKVISNRLETSDAIEICNDYCNMVYAQGDPQNLASWVPTYIFAVICSQTTHDSVCCLSTLLHHWRR